MHEHGIAQQMVTLALQQAQDHNAKSITHFRIEMSQTADESEDSLRFYLEELTRDTPAQGARFEIQRVPAPAHCLDCGNEFGQTYLGETCPRCHSTQVNADPQDEFKLSSIEIE